MAQCCLGYMISPASCYFHWKCFTNSPSFTKRQVADRDSFWIFGELIWFWTSLNVRVCLVSYFFHRFMMIICWKITTIIWTSSSDLLYFIMILSFFPVYFPSPQHLSCILLSPGFYRSLDLLRSSSI